MQVHTYNEDEPSPSMYTLELDLLEAPAGAVGQHNI
jgi:hypothetical protein